MTSRLGYTVAEAAAAIGVKPATLRTWVKNGKLRASRPNGKTLIISTRDLEALIQPELPVQPVSLSPVARRATSILRGFNKCKLVS